ncbi:MAG TPA: AzlD domain-containing protein [Peptococcaceae bacterium]|nr:AzlD domain-containing protein [Peptococcaceae bacterium]
MGQEILAIIVIMTAVTYGARVLPFLLFRNKRISGVLKSFIELVPVALLAALVIPELILTPTNEFTFINPFLLTGICTFIFARRVSNLFLVVLFGMVVYWGFDKII